MKYSNKLQLDKFFIQVKDLNYVIIKKPEHFPNYYKGSDIDIVCDNYNEFIKAILKVGNYYVLHDNFEMKIMSDEGSKHCHLDFFFNNELEFRIDVYGSLPKYKKIRIKQEFIVDLLNSKQEIERYYHQELYKIFIPSRISDLVIRYIEYIEWFEQRPDKIKHYDYVVSSLSSNDEQREFFKKLHLYTNFLYINKKSQKKFLIGEFVYKIIKQLWQRVYFFLKDIRNLVIGILKRLLSIVKNE